jgi:undecaprenyl-diphosphatase
MASELESTHVNIQDLETDRQNKYKAFIILLSSSVIFLCTLLGLMNPLSDQTAIILQEQLGFTNKWSKSFGPEWFVDINKDFSALGGLPLVSIFVVIIVSYYNLRNESRRLWRFLFILVLGAVLMYTVKLIFASDFPDDIKEFIICSVSSFPSGHAMMGAIFYTTLAVTISRRQHSKRTKRLTIISGLIIILIIGICRVLPGIHNLKDVIAGWSLGFAWLSFCWLLEQHIKKNQMRIV